MVITSAMIDALDSDIAAISVSAAAITHRLITKIRDSFDLADAFGSGMSSTRQTSRQQLRRFLSVAQEGTWLADRTPTMYNPPIMME